MKMFNKMPTHIYIDDRKYFINSDYRLMIEFEEKMQGTESLSNEEKTQVVFSSLYNFCPAFFKEKEYKIENLPKLQDEFLKFYKCGRENYHKGRATGRGISTVQAYSYEYDDEYIFGAFYDQYGIDLSSIKYLHWWKFKALFKALKDDCKFEQIVSYRSYIGKDEDRKRLRDYWKLPIDSKEQKELENLANELMKYNKK